MQVEVGQLRRGRDDLAPARRGTMCLVTQCFDRGVDVGGNQWARIYTVLMDDPDPWFYEQELEDYTELVE